MIAPLLFPQLPAALSSATLMTLGKEQLRRYNLARAGGAATKRIDIFYEGKTLTIREYSVEVPLDRKLLRDADEAKALDIASHLDVAQLAMSTARGVLDLDYELEAADMALDPTSYRAGHVRTLSGAARWSAALTGTPIADIADACALVRRQTGRRPNLLVIAPDALLAVQHSLDVLTYQSSDASGPATIEELQRILNIPRIVVGEAIWMPNDSTTADVWRSGTAVLACVPEIPATTEGGEVPTLNILQSAFGLTFAPDDQPAAETPYYEPNTKTWVFGANYERRTYITDNSAAFLFQGVV